MLSYDQLMLYMLYIYVMLYMDEEWEINILDTVCSKQICRIRKVGKGKNEGEWRGKKGEQK